MKILFLSFYFEPDLCAGSFRNSSLFKELLPIIKTEDQLDVITTHPNRYDSYKVKAKSLENPSSNVTINRIEIPSHGGGIFGQIKSFKKFYFEAKKIAKKEKYDLVYASSSRLFTACLGAKIARIHKAKLYLDIRDIFRETIVDVYSNSIIKTVLNTILVPIENYTFGRANHINLVSEGFKPYFDKYKKNYTFFTNGIDSIFLNPKKIEYVQNEKRKTIFYGGNIGESQGLHIIIPEAAEKLKDKFDFLIVGDGAVKDKLEKEVKERGLKNVSLLPPVNRDTLIEYYQKTDYLFLHLNKQKAFERVLPSKIFEYGAFNKPVIAGVSGFSKLFLEDNLKNVITFQPGEVEEFISKLESKPYENIERKEFKEKFSREKINKEMAKSILSLL